MSGFKDLNKADGSQMGGTVTGTGREDERNRHDQNMNGQQQNDAGNQMGNRKKQSIDELDPRPIMNDERSQK